jgi:hypothetical protein
VGEARQSHNKLEAIGDGGAEGEIRLASGDVRSGEVRR